MDAVEQGFAQELKDARLTEISYNEQASSTYADSFKKQASDEVIVVFTNFITVFHLFPSEEQLLEPNTTYKGYPGYCGVPQIKRHGKSLARDMDICIRKRTA